MLKRNKKRGKREKREKRDQDILQLQSNLKKLLKRQSRAYDKQPQEFKNDFKYMAWIYLARKFKDVACIPMSRVDQREHLGSMFAFDKANDNFYFPRDWDQDIADCKRRLILYSLTVYDSKTPDSNAHGTMVIVDSKKKTIELFDSAWEKRNNRPSPVDLRMAVFAKNHGLKYISPQEIAYRKEYSLQHMQEDDTIWRGQYQSAEVGHCSSWAFLYADLRLANPDISPLLVSEMLQKDLNADGKSTEAVRRYRQWVMRFSPLILAKYKKSKKVGETLENFLIRNFHDLSRKPLRYM